MKLEVQLRSVMRARHYSIRTVDAYVLWYKRFVKFHRRRHPRELGAAEVEQFLAHLVVDRHVAGSTQAQALNALVFLYEHARGPASSTSTMTGTWIATPAVMTCLTAFM